jgi:hypothetical protein
VGRVPAGTEVPAFRRPPLWDRKPSRPLPGTGQRGPDRGTGGHRGPGHARPTEPTRPGTEPERAGRRSRRPGAKASVAPRCLSLQ